MKGFIQSAKSFLTRDSPKWERRLHKRAQRVWRELQKDQVIPLVDQCHLLDLEDNCAHGFLLDIQDPGNVALAYVGEILREEAHLDRETTRLDEVDPRSLLAQFGNRWQDVVLARAPATHEYSFETESGYKVLCRGVLLPFSKNGTDIDHAYGVVTWKSEKVASRCA